MAFAIPMIQRLANEKGRGLVIVPTRELAYQVEESILKISQTMKIRTVTLVGGEPVHKQIKLLHQNPRILIATPGRLIDLMEQRKVHLRDIRILVLDEADRMLDMGFAPQINTILKGVPKKRQTMFFSATIPPPIVRMTSLYMSTPVHVEERRLRESHTRCSLSTGIKKEIF